MASQQEIFQTLLSVGANAAEARALSAIAMAESGGNNDAYNPNGEDSVGWYQINLRAHGDKIDFKGATDPTRSSQYALELFKSQGTRPWSVTHADVGAPYLKYINTPLTPKALPRTGGDPTPTGQVTAGDVAGDINANGGTGPAVERLASGQQIVWNGKTYDVLTVNANGVMVKEPGTGGISAIRLPGGTYGIPGLNTSVQVDALGNILKSGAPDKPAKGSYVWITDSAGLPVKLYEDGTTEGADGNELKLLGFDPDPNTGTASGPTITGSSAPDPVGAASVLLRAYEDQIANSNGVFDAEKAFAQFQMDWQKLLGDISTTNATLQGQTNIAQGNLQADTNATNVTNVGNYLSDATTRARAEAERALGVANEATNRADIVTSKVLPQWIQGASHLNVPLLGQIPLTQLDVGQLFSQGGQGDLSNVTPISPNPAIPYGGPIAAPQLPMAPQAPMPGPMPNFPAAPQYPAAPDVSAMIQAALQGFPGFAF